MNDKLLLIVVVTIAATSISIILMSVGSYPNMALSKPSVHTKSSTTGTASNNVVAGNSGLTTYSNNNNKVVILSFDDNRLGDFVYAKPILDKYGFKATFFHHLRQNDR